MTHYWIIKKIYYSDYWCTQLLSFPTKQRKAFIDKLVWTKWVNVD